MGYVDSVLQPGERVVVRAHLHWIVYWIAIISAAAGIVLAVWAKSIGMQDVSWFVAIAFGAIAVVAFLHAWFIRWITEIAVTDRRIIYKRGFITRHTVEMNMDKVAAVDVDQSILGRILDYGSVHVVGTGGSPNNSEGGDVRGIEHLHRVAAPLALRSAITAK